MQLFLHLGAHKTASTHLQSRLQKARRRLWGQHVSCIVPQQTRAGEVQLSTLVQFPGRWPEVERAWRKRLDLIESQGVTRCVISEENLLGEIRPRLLLSRDGRLYPDAERRLGALFAILGRRPDRLFLGVREPASFVTSAFGMWLRAGSGFLIEDFLDRADPAVMRWSAFGARLLALPGAPALTFWRFEDYAALRQQIVAALVGAQAATVVGAAPRELIGWSQAAYDAFLTSVLEDDGDTPLRTLAMAARQAWPRGPENPGMEVLPADVLRACAAGYDADVAVLAGLAGAEQLTAA